MDTRYVCPECCFEHMEPNEPSLGITAACFVCALDAELARYQALASDVTESPATRAAA